MFSFVCAGNIFSSRSNIYNTLAMAAFFMLIYNPFSIMDVGFQLSFIAVLSIVFFQPHIYPLLKFNSYLPDQLWQLISVTLAAQIGTFPLTLLYFHRFPTYFILSNIFVIPISMFIIYFAVFLLVFSFSEFISTIVAFGLKMLVKFMNFAVRFIENIPYSTIESLYINATEFLFIFTMLLILSFFIITKKLNYLRFSFLFMIVILLINTFKIYTIRHESGLIVYNIPKTSAIEFYSGQQNKLFINKQNEELTELIPFNFHPFWDFQQINHPEIIQKEITNENLFNSFKFQNQKIVQINKSELFRHESSVPFKTDILILSENLNIQMKDLKKYFDFSLVIFDSSNSENKIKKWKNDCRAYGIDYYSVPESGAFILKNEFSFR